ncbi:hypothetical protein GIB67_020753, partial [Kingdonia uniflora]
ILTNKAIVANDGKPLPLYQKPLCGLAVGAIKAFIRSLTELVLIQMQADATLPLAQYKNYKNAFHSLAYISVDEGVTALWKEILAIIVDILVHSSLLSRDFAVRTSPMLIEEVEQSLHDAIMIIRRALKNSTMVVGGENRMSALARSRSPNLQILSRYDGNSTVGHRLYKEITKVEFVKMKGKGSLTQPTNSYQCIYVTEVESFKQIGLQIDPD